MPLKKESRWTRRLFAGLPGWGLAGALGASTLGACGLAVRGQDAAVESGPTRTYLNKPFINLPIEIEGAYRAQISSLVLYAKEGANGAWSVREKAAPMQTSFTFRAPRDGEYWFRIVAIDNQGKAHPDDLSKDPQDTVVVVVDSSAPTLDVTYDGNVPEGQIVHCDMRDANPDLLKMRFFYQTRDQAWRNLEHLPDQPNRFCVPAQAALTNFIRVLAVDLAGNTTARTLNLSELAAAAPPRNPPRLVQTAANSTPSPLPQTAIQPPPQTAIIQPRPNAIPISNEPVPAPRAPLTADPVVVFPTGPTQVQQPINAPRVNKAAPLPPGPQIINIGPNLDVTPITKPAEPAPLPEIETTSGTLSKPMAPANLQVVGSPQIFLNYALENTGPSGVGKVEIYATRDRGQSWHKIAEDTQRKNPAEVVLPGEGVFGLKLVAANGRGFGAQPPQAGDASDWWVEVDTTKPQVKITGIRPGTGQESGSLHLFWQSEDRNLAIDGVELYYAASREGPWTPIAKNLKSSGQHRWSPANDAGAHAFLRVVVRDRAGNVGLSETTQPIPLDDQSRPRAKVIGVTASPTVHSSANTPGRVQQVETTSTPIDAPSARLPRGPQTSSSLGVDVR
jgi:hypothetical protein